MTVRCLLGVHRSSLEFPRLRLAVHSIYHTPSILFPHLSPPANSMIDTLYASPTSKNRVPYLIKTVNELDQNLKARTTCKKLLHSWFKPRALRQTDLSTMNRWCHALSWFLHAASMEKRTGFADGLLRLSFLSDITSLYNFRTEFLLLLYTECYMVLTSC